MFATLRQMLEQLIDHRDFPSRLPKTGQEEHDKTIDLINDLLA